MYNILNNMDEKLFLCESFVQTVLQQHKITDEKIISVWTIDKNGVENNIKSNENEKISQTIYNILTNKSMVENLSKIVLYKNDDLSKTRLNEIEIN